MVNGEMPCTRVCRARWYLALQTHLGKDHSSRQGEHEWGIREEFGGEMDANIWLGSLNALAGKCTGGNQDGIKNS